MKIEELRRKLDFDEKYRDLLFIGGWLLTEDDVDLESYPFYGNWKKSEIGKFNLYVQNEQTVATATENGKTSVIIGNAYNPFTKQGSEKVLCEELLKTDSFFEKISEFSGIHVIFSFSEKFTACQDACGYMGCFFGQVGGKTYLSDSPQLIADVCDLKMSPTVKKLLGTKCFRMGNSYLPGDVTPYEEIKRLGPNTFLDFTDGFEVKRFFPTEPHSEATSAEDKQKVVEEVSEALHNALALCAEKWGNPAISLTGGTDSQTTLSCANGLYGKFQYYSFASKSPEQTDADAARDICEHIGLKHDFYKIPDDNSYFSDFELGKTVLLHNTGYYLNVPDSEIRKMLYMRENRKYGVDVKSWASEIARVYLERRYGVKFPNPLNARVCSVTQTRFFGHPSLLKYSDDEYRKFLIKMGLDKPLFNYESGDLLYWEIRMCSWGSQVMTLQRPLNVMTVPMNNRKILTAMLAYPREERKTDSFHREIIGRMNGKILEMNTQVHNGYMTLRRRLPEKAFYLYRTVFYKKKP